MDNVDSMTILKYKIGTGVNAQYKMHVMDKWEKDNEGPEGRYLTEEERLDKMIKFSEALSKRYEYYEQLWIKTCPVFPTK